MMSPAPIEGSDALPAPALVPTGIRVASTLCWAVGILTLLMAFATEMPAMRDSGPKRYEFALSVIAGVTVCLAGFLVRKRMRAGALLLVLAWATPAVIGILSNGVAIPGNPILLIALVCVLWNWKLLA